MMTPTIKEPVFTEEDYIRYHVNICYWPWQRNVWVWME